MSEFKQPSADVDERTERLICRVLDSEATAQEFAALESLMMSDAAVRAMYQSYQATDSMAARALRAEFESATTAVAGSVRRGLWLATAGAVLSAAAVLAFSFVPKLWTGRVVDSRLEDRTVSPQTQLPARPHAIEPTYVDFRGGDNLPRARQRDVLRDVIGIRGPNNEIYLFERGQESTRMTPISGEF